MSPGGGRPGCQLRVKADFKNGEEFAFVEQAVEAGLLGIGVGIMHAGSQVDIGLGPVHSECAKPSVGQRDDEVRPVDRVQKICPEIL